LLIDGLKTV